MSHRDVRSSDGLRGVLVREHAVGGRDDVLAGHQGAATELTTVGEESHHPGIFVFLRGHSIDYRYSLQYAQSTLRDYYYWTPKGPKKP